MALRLDLDVGSVVVTSTTAKLRGPNQTSVVFWKGPRLYSEAVPSAKLETMLEKKGEESRGDLDRCSNIYISEHGPEPPYLPASR